MLLIVWHSRTGAAQAMAQATFEAACSAGSCRMIGAHEAASDDLLAAQGVTVNRYRKPTFTRPAPTALRQQIAAENQLVIEGLAD